MSAANGATPSDEPSGDRGSSPEPPGQPGTSRRSVVALAAVLLAAALAGAALAVVRPWAPVGQVGCTPSDHPDWSVARRWDEALLDAIRRALPNPPVHARNLFHTSVAMWDAWAAYDETAKGYIVTEKRRAADQTAARNEAMSYAAYRVLTARFETGVGGSDSLAEFDELMRSLCYDVDVRTAEGESPAALGNRIAEAILAYGRSDGSNEANGYTDPEYLPVNEPLVVKKPGTTMADPNRWQPLQIEHMVSQNGILLTNGVQQNVGPHWGRVKGFGIPDGGAAGMPFDPGPPPRLGDSASDQAYKEQALEVIRRSSELGTAAGAMLDISPASFGNNPLGTNDGHGHASNPATGEAYEAEVVDQGDFTRALTEFWADGPRSETPPGHWNVIANAVSDAIAPNLRIGGGGPVVDRLEWDVKLYLALNGAVHDAAVAAWGLKGHYDSARPISMIRYLAGRGQSSDPAMPSYDPEGIPLVPGLVELISKRTTAPDQRHAGLAGHEDEIAILAWAGNPADPTTETSGVAWILAANWVPYQLPTFVTPSFSGYVSGHSTFSRAAAEVLAGFTGSEFFPGGLTGWTIEPGVLKVEAGPTRSVTLQWATYDDAADQAGLSRLYGGIHIAADDFKGRQVGALCGQAAWALAQRYYAGIRP